jgi:hypothetical protein
LITTLDSGGNLLDGPSQTNVYTIKKIVSRDLADDAITTPKIAEGVIAPFVIERSTLDPVSVPPNDFSPVTPVFCEAGEQAVGGGFFTFYSAARFLRLVESTHNSGNGWQAQIVNEYTVNAHSFGVVITCKPALP